MDKLPATILYPDKFLKSPSAGFDGVFDWSWTDGCFGNKNITPMDVDGVVERKGHFIVFETKDINVPIKKGQYIMLWELYKKGKVTVVFIYGKTIPEQMKVWCANGFKDGKIMKEFSDTSLERARKFVSDWYEYADRNKQ